MTPRDHTPCELRFALEPHVQRRREQAVRALRAAGLGGDADRLASSLRPHTIRHLAKHAAYVAMSEARPAALPALEALYALADEIGCEGSVRTSVERHLQHVRDRGQKANRLEEEFMRAVAAERAAALEVERAETPRDRTLAYLDWVRASTWANALQRKLGW